VFAAEKVTYLQQTQDVENSSD